MVGATPADFKALLPVFEAYCENVVHAGPPGHGLVLKATHTAPASMDPLARQPVVIDNGCGSVKAGFAGDDRPKLWVDNVVGRVKHRRVMAGGALDGDAFVGPTLSEHRGALSLSYPMERGVVQDWDDMQRVWTFAFDGIGANAKDHPVLLTEPPLNPAGNREKCAEVLFEHFNAPAVYVGVQPTLALYASGRTTGLVLDVGECVSHAVPVYEGFALTSAISRMDYGGRDVTRHLAGLLRRSGAAALCTSAELGLLARDVKEGACYVAANPAAEETAVHEGTFRGSQEFRLPDGQRVTLGAERFRAPEALFSPSLLGSEAPDVAEAVMLATARVDVSLRRPLLGSVVLAGGSTLFRGFGERVLDGVRRRAPSDCRVKVWAPADRRALVWVGGSILGSLGTFRSMWVTRAQWAEHGPSLIHRAAL